MLDTLEGLTAFTVSLSFVDRQTDYNQTDKSKDEGPKHQY